MLPRAAYVDQTVFEWERRHFYGGWVGVVHADQLANPGDQRAEASGDGGVLLVGGDAGLVFHRNPVLAESRTLEREAMLAAAEADLEKIPKSARTGRLKDKDKIKVLACKVAGRYFSWEITDSGFVFRRDMAKIAAAARLDGIRIIRNHERRYRDCRNGDANAAHDGLPLYRYRDLIGHLATPGRQVIVSQRPENREAHAPAPGTGPRFRPARHPSPGQADVALRADDSPAATPATPPARPLVNRPSGDRPNPVAVTTTGTGPPGCDSHGVAAQRACPVSAGMGTGLRWHACRITTTGRTKHRSGAIRISGHT